MFDLLDRVGIDRSGVQVNFQQAATKRRISDVVPLRNVLEEDTTCSDRIPRSYALRHICSKLY